MESRNSEPPGGLQHAVLYPRHFALLSGVAAALGCADRWRQGLGALAAVALYGALHSTSLVAALRVPQAAWRKLSFIAIAAGLAMLSVSVALAGYRLLGTGLGIGAPAFLLTVSSTLGAASYAVLIRHFWIRNLSHRSLIEITLCCASVTLAALPLGRYLHTAGTWWFALVWWWSFSLTLWYQEARMQGLEARPFARRPSADIRSGKNGRVL